MSQEVELVLLLLFTVWFCITGIGVDCHYSGGETAPQSCCPFTPCRWTY